MTAVLYVWTGQSLPCYTLSQRGVLQGGFCAERLLQKVTGLWAFACQSRRPMFSLFQEAYRVGHLDGKAREPFQLPLALRTELEVASVLGLLAVSDLKAQVSPIVYGTGASPSGAGVVACDVRQDVAKELRRRADHFPGKGYEVEEPEWLMQQNALQSSGENSSPGPSVNVGPRFSERIHAELEPRTGGWSNFVNACWRLYRTPKTEFRLDFLEVYVGTAKLSRAMLDLGFTVGPPHRA